MRPPGVAKWHDCPPPDSPREGSEGLVSVAEEPPVAEPDEQLIALAGPMIPRTLARSLQILQIVSVDDHAPLSLAEISRRSGLPKPTVHRLAGALRDSGMLQRDGSGRYRPGPMLLVMGTNYLRKSRLREVSKTPLLRLHHVTSKSVYLSVPQSPWIVNIARIEGDESSALASPVGSLNPQHTTAGGKAVLAFSGREEIRRVIEADLHRKTSQSITETARLMHELNEIVERGYATEFSENMPGVISVAAPIRDQSRRPIGAVGVSAMESETSPLSVRQWGMDSVRTATQISNEIGWFEAGDKPVVGNG